MTALLMCAAMVWAPSAFAYDNGLPLNGTYLVTSNGDWAKSNEVYHDEESKRSTWTISSQCDNPQYCKGTVTSDEGWTAVLEWHVERWFVRRVIPDWQPCADGTSSSGEELFRFYPVNAADGTVLVGSPTLAGEDITTGVSGACGKSLPLQIRMPLRLDKTS